MEFHDKPYVRALVAKQGLEVHLKTGGKMRLTRMATPKRLLTVIGAMTGKKYKTSANGMQEALVDITKYLQDAKDEYEVQQTIRVREVPYNDNDVTRSQVLVYSNTSARDALINANLLLTGKAQDLTNDTVRQRLNLLIYRKGCALFLKQGVELFCVLHNVLAKRCEDENGTNHEA